MIEQDAIKKEKVDLQTLGFLKKILLQYWSKNSMD